MRYKETQEAKYYKGQYEKLSGTGKFYYNQAIRWGKTPKQAMAYVALKTTANMKSFRKNLTPIEKTKNILSTDGWAQKDFFRGKLR